MKQQEITLVQRACSKVTGFKRLPKQLEKKIIVGGAKSLSTLNNYMRCIIKQNVVGNSFKFILHNLILA
jgi:hypothetical protein